VSLSVPVGTLVLLPPQQEGADPQWLAGGRLHHMWGPNSPQLARSHRFNGTPTLPCRGAPLFQQSLYQAVRAVSYCLDQKSYFALSDPTD